MFDVGFSELLLLAVVGLLVLGPERLPRVARTLGGLTRKARSSWMNLKRSIDAEINAEELKKPLRKMQDEVRSAVGVVDEQLKKATEVANSPVTGKTANPSASANPAAGIPAAATTPSNAKSANND
jgi:sec-independent protein translocase protein TatB